MVIVQRSKGTHQRHQVSKRFVMSHRTLRRLVIALYMTSSALAGAILQAIADNGWHF